MIKIFHYCQNLIVQGLSTTQVNLTMTKIHKPACVVKIFAGGNH